MPPSVSVTVIALACLIPAFPADQAAGTPGATAGPAAGGAAGAGAAPTSSFTTTVTPDQPAAPGSDHGGGARAAALCWSGGEDSWSRQGQRQALAARAAADPQLDERKAAFIAAVARWREAIGHRQYDAAEAVLVSTFALLDDLAARQVQVSEQIAFTKREYAQCLVDDALARLAGDWPGAGEASLALARRALAQRPGDFGALQAADAAQAAACEQRGRLIRQQAAALGQRIDQLAAQALADRAEAERLHANGDGDGEGARARHAAACLDDCLHDVQRLLPLETAARAAFQDAIAAGQALMARAREAERDGHPLTAFGVPECATLSAAQAALLGAADAALARDYLLLGKADLGLPLAREALQWVPGSPSYLELCRRLEACSGAARPLP